MTEGKRSLKKSVLRGSAWTMVGVGASQAMRLGKSLILSRLLFPEAYGVMAIVWAVLYALEMLSDVGIAPAVIRSQRGDDPKFLNTAWTMKTIRGAVLCAIACALAYPISVFYEQPDLALLIPVAGLTSLLEGFCSTNIYSCQRNMVYGKITLLDLSNEVVGLLVTLTWAYFYPSAWALLGGAIVGRIYHVSASHFILPGIKNRFHWDTKAYQELIHFGKWIFFSSAVFLLYAQGDRMLLGKYLDATTLGIYTIAIMLSESVVNVVTKLNNSVLYPALSRVANSEPHRLKEVFYRTRLGTDALMVIPICILMVIGERLVHLLYDSRYAAAGWMLQILCVRMLMTATLIGSASCLFALGHSKYSFIQNLFRAGWILIGIPLIWPLYGMEGIIWVVGLTEIPVLFVLWFGMSKYGILSVKHELRTLPFIATGLLIGFALLQLPIGRT
jgi:O-antigen/teichoic acid export membrane protein